MTVGVHFGMHARQRNRGARGLFGDVRNRHYRGSLQYLSATTDMFFTDSAGTDDT